MVTRAALSTALNVSLRGVRQRRWRERQKCPVRSVYRIEVERDAIRQALITSGRLSVNDISNRERIALALNLMIAEWANWMNHKWIPRTTR
jgi:hypothetical protein